MLQKSHRLTTRAFGEVMKEGRPHHSRLFLVRIMDAGVQEAAKVSAVAPVRVGKTAVLRNRIRRRIYEAAEPLVKKLSKGYRVVIFAKTPAIEAEVGDMTSDLQDIFVKTRLLR